MGGRSSQRIARWLSVGAAALLVAPASAAADETLGDPLPNPTQLWDALSVEFDGVNGLDVVIVRHDGVNENIGGFYLADGSGGWVLSRRFPGGDRHGCDAGDVDGDGLADVYCELGAEQGSGTANNELWLHDPATGFIVNRSAVWGVADPYGRGRRPLLFDQNGDGLLDLYTTVWGARTDGQPNYNRLFVNTGTSFEERATEATGWQVGAQCVADADWNDDGLRDLIVCGNTTANVNLRLYRSTPTGQVDASSLLGTPVQRPRDVQVADLNSDGLDDLVVVRETRVEVRLNRGSGRRFGRVAPWRPLVDGQRGLVEDLTGDGNADIYVTEGCRPGGVHVPDRLYAGPDYRQVALPPGPATGCGGEVVDAGRLLTFDGEEAAPGPVTILDLPLSVP